MQLPTVCNDRQGGEYNFMNGAAVTHCPPFVQRVRERGSSETQFS